MNTDSRHSETVYSEEKFWIQRKATVLVGELVLWSGGGAFAMIGAARTLYFWALIHLGPAQLLLPSIRNELSPLGEQSLAAIATIAICSVTGPVGVGLYLKWPSGKTALLSFIGISLWFLAGVAITFSEGV